MESQIVGYTTVEYGSQFKLNGNMFVNVGDNTKYNLYDFKIVGGDPDMDYIQFLETTKLHFDNEKKFYYYEDEEHTDDGWYYKSGSKMEELVEYDDAWIPANVAALCEFRSSSDVKLQYAGQVKLATDGAVTLERPQQLNLYCNPLPRTVDLTEIKIVNGDPDMDYIQFLEKSKLHFDNEKKFYYYEDEDHTDDGWYYKSGSKMEEPVEVGDCVIGVGEGFLGEFRSSADTALVFPDPLAAPKDE